MSKLLRLHWSRCELSQGLEMFFLALLVASLLAILCCNKTVLNLFVTEKYAQFLVRIAHCTFFNPSFKPWSLADSFWGHLKYEWVMIQAFLLSGPTLLVRDWSLVDYCFDAFGMLLHMAVGGYLLVNDVVGTSSCHRPKFWDQWFGGTQLPSLSNSIAATAVRESYCQQTEHPITYIHSGNFAPIFFLTIPLDWVSSALEDEFPMQRLAAAA